MPSPARRTLRKAILPASALSLGALLVAVPPFLAVAEDPTWTTVADKGLSVFGASSDSVKIAAIFGGVLLAGWGLFLAINRRAPAPTSPPSHAASHTTDEVFALLNSLSERLDSLAERLDRHVDHHAANP